MSAQALRPLATVDPIISVTREANASSVFGLILRPSPELPGSITQKQATTAIHSPGLGAPKFEVPGAAVALATPWASRFTRPVR